jgi:hypothetical protein
MNDSSVKAPRVPIGTLVLLATLVLAGLRPSMLRLILPGASSSVAPGPADGLDRKPLRYRGDPGPPEIVRFVESVRQETHPGAKIILLFPPPFDGFSYAYWRTSYLLSGRTVLLPLSPPDFEQADYVAVIGVPFADPRFQHVWSGRRGESLWSRRR